MRRWRVRRCQLVAGWLVRVGRAVALDSFSSPRTNLDNQQLRY
jgi:hypothetical protein